MGPYAFNSQVKFAPCFGQVTKSGTYTEVKAYKALKPRQVHPPYIVLTVFHDDNAAVLLALSCSQFAILRIVPLGLEYQRQGNLEEVREIG